MKTVDGAHSDRTRYDEKRRILFGWVTHLLQPVVAVGTQLLMVPIFLAHWDQATFATWVTLYALSSLVPVADLGLQSVALNLFQRARVSVDPEGRTGHVYSRILGAYALVAVATAGILLAVLSFIAWLAPSLLGGGDRTNTFIAAAILIVASTICLPSSISSMLYRANDRAAIVPLLSSLATILTLLVQTIVIAGGGGLVAAATVQAGGMAGLAAYLIFLHQPRTFPGVRWRWRLRSAASTLSELKGAAQYGAASAVDLILSYVPVLLVGILVGQAAAVVTWSLARTLTVSVRQVGVQMALPIIAEVGREYRAGSSQGVAGLLNASLLSTLIVTAVLCAGLLTMGEGFFRIWTHGAATWDPTLVAILLLGAAIAAPSTIAQLFALYSGRGRLLLVSKVSQLVTALLLALPLTYLWGPAGLATALTIAEAAALMGFLWPRLLSKALQDDKGTILSVGGATVAAFVVSSIAGIAAVWAVPPGDFRHLIAGGALWAAVSGIAMLALLPPSWRRGLLVKR